VTANPATRTELAEFLRTRRARLSPAQVGLPANGHSQRRTPGLRRHEVAQLAGISVDYYIRLDQARGPHPSRQVLTSLARALMLTADEREYLFKITGRATPAMTGPSIDVSPAIQYLLDSLVDVPAYVVDAKYDILAWNSLAIHFIGDLSTFTEGHRNMLRWMFTNGDNAVHWADPDSVAFARSLIADLRAARASYPGDRGIGNLVTELLAVSATFTAMWREHDADQGETLGVGEQRCPDQLIGDTGTVVLGSIDVIDVQFGRTAEDRDGRISVSRRAEHPRTWQLHRAEADARHGCRPQNIVLRTATPTSRPFLEEVHRWDPSRVPCPRFGAGACHGP